MADMMMVDRADYSTLVNSYLEMLALMKVQDVRLRKVEQQVLALAKVAAANGWVLPEDWSDYSELDHAEAAQKAVQAATEKAERRNHRLRSSASTLAMMGASHG